MLNREIWSKYKCRKIHTNDIFLYSLKIAIKLKNIHIYLNISDCI